MKTSKTEFTNSEGIRLTARIEVPADRKPIGFALFAHCFTCNKNLPAVRNISRALTGAGLGVMRFDFTGLGESEGEFSDTNFSGNIRDIRSAALFLKKHYRAPGLLIGHSLGGAAVLHAAAEIDSVNAIATIGAPADPRHVTRLLKNGMEDLEKNGSAAISIGGRPFTIKKQFIDDLTTVDMTSVLAGMRKALLIAHSPQDEIVGIQNAADLFKAARHPKSFVSLDGADHLLSNPADSIYIGEVIAQWAKRYIADKEAPKPDTHLQVVASLDSQEKFTTRIKAGKHYLIADEPGSVGGNDFGPTPNDLVSAGLATCTAMTIRMYADRKNWILDEVNVHIRHSKIHAHDCNTCEDSTSAKIDLFTRVIELKGNLDKQQRQRLLEIANKCPVHKTLRSETAIKTELLT
ncbi:MAG: bifunctional alpha/beta hydrolase/OsmC family protein [Bacteroidales bacterium]